MAEEQSRPLSAEEVESLEARHLPHPVLGFE